MLRQQLQDLEPSPALAGPRLADQLEQAGAGGGGGGQREAFGAAVRPLQRTYLYEAIAPEAGGALPAAALAGDGAAAVDACMRAYRDAGPGASWQTSKVGKFVLEGVGEEAERLPRERGSNEQARRARAGVR